MGQQVHAPDTSTESKPGSRPGVEWAPGCGGGNRMPTTASSTTNLRKRTNGVDSAGTKRVFGYPDGKYGILAYSYPSVSGGIHSATTWKRPKTRPRGSTAERCFGRRSAAKPQGAYSEGCRLVAKPGFRRRGAGGDDGNAPSRPGPENTAGTAASRDCPRRPCRRPRVLDIDPFVSRFGVYFRGIADGNRPAIDLRGGNCVRLLQGDYGRETVFGDDPAAMARRWVAEGAGSCTWWIWTVPATAERSIARRSRPIVQAVDVPCELGGGIRDEETIRELLDLGLDAAGDRHQALKDPDWFRAMCRQFPGRLVVGIDARDGRVATEAGWRPARSRRPSWPASLRGEPLAAIIYTDIATDGMLAGRTSRRWPRCRRRSTCRWSPPAA